MMLGVKKQQGFTLLELMITMVVIVVISAIAIPGYLEYIKDSRRTAAQSALLGFAHAMEKHKLETGTYSNPGADIFPDKAPLDSSRKFYDLSVTAATQNYTLYAIPIADTQQADNGALRLKSTGERGWDKDDDGSYSYSWR